MGKREKQPPSLPDLAQKIAANIKKELPTKRGLKTRRGILAYIRKQIRQKGRFAINADNLLVETKNAKSKELLKPIGDRAERRYKRTLKANTKKLEGLVYSIIQSLLNDQEIEINNTIKKRYKQDDESRLLKEVISQQHRIPPLIGYLILKGRLSSAIVDHLGKPNVNWDDEFSQYERTYAEAQLRILVRASLRGNLKRIKTEFSESATSELERFMPDDKIENIYQSALKTSKTRKEVHSTVKSLIVSELQTDLESKGLSTYVGSRLIKIARQKIKHEWKLIGNRVIDSAMSEVSNFMQRHYISSKQKETRLRRNSLITSLEEGYGVRKLALEEFYNSKDAFDNLFQKTHLKKLLKELFEDWENKIRKRQKNEIN